MALVRLPLKKEANVCASTLIAVHQLLHYGSPQITSGSGSLLRTFEELHSNWVSRQREIGGTGVILAQYSYALMKKIQFGLTFPIFNGNFTPKPSTLVTPNPAIISAMLDVQACLLSVQDLVLQMVTHHTYLLDCLNILIMDTYALAQALQGLLSRQAGTSSSPFHLHLHLHLLPLPF
jgi:hypothetical protein